jgi:hypothetical protein
VAGRRHNLRNKSGPCLAWRMPGPLGIGRRERPYEEEGGAAGWPGGEAHNCEQHALTVSCCSCFSSLKQN